MATYAIGDIQGCFNTLQRLLERINLQPNDHLWLAGDLVNRGPDSLRVLRWAKELGERATVVLGNHDLRLLCIAQQACEKRPSDTIDDVLTAPDRDELLAWLQGRPLLVRRGTHALVHAGLLPSWTMDTAMELHAEVTTALRGPHVRDFFVHLCKESPSQWQPDMTGLTRLAMITKALTYVRICTGNDAMLLNFSGAPSLAPSGYLPWFQHPWRKSRDTTIICGHWAALGLHLDDNIRALDSGCVWGRALTAYRLDDGSLFQEPAHPL